MADQSMWGSEEVLKLLKNRSIDNFFPSLKAHLHPDAKVLDVGCGPGTVTVGVAAAVAEGSVTGVDFAEQSIVSAQRLAEELKLANAHFRVMNAYDLQFADGSFDLTYSHNLLTWLSDPLKALHEQKRVTRRGGKVIAGVGDYGTTLIYPPCPAVEKIINALVYLNDPAEPATFFNANLGREAFALFSELGLGDIQIFGEVTRLETGYQGSDFFEDRYGFLKLITNINPALDILHQRLISLGHLDEATYQTAQAEVEHWHKHPHAFQMETRIIAVGEVV